MPETSPSPTFAHRPEFALLQFALLQWPGPRTHAEHRARRIDRSHPAPFDAVLPVGGNRGIAVAAQRVGLHASVGVEIPGKPWTTSLAKPARRHSEARIIPRPAAHPAPSR